VAAALSADQETHVEVSASGLPLAIPDNGQPVFSMVEVSQSGNVRDLRVSVDISHTYIGDLRVDLVAPDGSAVTLH
jgi:subtilisin-like proprotein convertase family protein